MTISHEQIKLNVAQAIAEDADIRAYCVENFGRPLQVIVNRYGAEGFPGEAEAPFAFLYSDGENELGAVDEETFDFCIVVGAVDASDSPTKNAVMVRSDSSSGLVVCGIADKVALILGAGDYEKGKPSPSGYLKAAQLLGVNPEACVVIEDSTVGVAAGVAAGMKVIALDRATSIPQHFEGETWRVRDLSELDVEKEFGA